MKEPPSQELARLLRGPLASSQHHPQTRGPVNMTARQRYIHSQSGFGIVFVIVVALTIVSLVTFVFQTGKDKTIWSDQLTSNSGASQSQIPGAGPIPQTIVHRTRVGGVHFHTRSATPIQTVQSLPQSAMGTQKTVTIHCPVCNTQGIPVCSSCGSVMQGFSGMRQSYVCPTCGQLGVPICPRCGAHMKTGPQQTSPPASNRNAIAIAAP